MKKTFRIIYIQFSWIILFIHCSLIAQETTRNDSLAKYSHEELSEKFYAAKPDSLKAVLYAKYAIIKAKKEKDTLELGSGYYWLSDITKDSTYYVNYWNDIIRKTKNTNNKLYPALSYLQLGDFYYQKGSKDTALKKYLLANKELVNKKNDSIKAYVLTRLGLMKIRIEDYDEALNLFRQSMMYFNHKGKSFPEYYSLLLNTVTVFNRTKRFDSAYYYSDKLISTAIKQNDSTVLGYGFTSKGKIALYKEDYNDAILNFKKSIPHIINDENYITLSSCFLNIAQSYSKINDKKNAFRYNNKVDSLFNKTKNYY
ncbi:MAG: hypothetical protein HWD85_09135, partial [Flavobacteriaceae bacterium]|nr:hypothetical protein [Flavobacteriaceae bacterium]